jgi:hypothetical protein
MRAERTQPRCHHTVTLTGPGVPDMTLRCLLNEGHKGVHSFDLTK